MENYTEFKNAGRLERDYSTESVKTSTPKKTKTVYTRVNVDSKNFPYLHNLKIGEKCDLKVKIKKVAESEPDSYETDKDNKITIEILQISEPKTSSADYKELIEEGKKKIKEE